MLPYTPKKTLKFVYDAKRGKYRIEGVSTTRIDAATGAILIPALSRYAYSDPRYRYSVLSRALLFNRRATSIHFTIEGTFAMQSIAERIMQSMVDYGPLSIAVRSVSFPSIDKVLIEVVATWGDYRVPLQLTLPASGDRL